MAGNHSRHDDERAEATEAAREVAPPAATLPQAIETDRDTVVAVLAAGPPAPAVVDAADPLHRMEECIEAIVIATDELDAAAKDEAKMQQCREALRTALIVFKTLMDSDTWKRLQPHIRDFFASRLVGLSSKREMLAILGYLILESSNFSFHEALSHGGRAIHIWAAQLRRGN